VYVPRRSGQSLSRRSATRWACAILTVSATACSELAREVTPPSAVVLTGGASYYAAPSGTPTGDGSIINPWDLRTAFGGGGRVQAGDTVWLRGGLYNGFTSQLLVTTIGAPGAFVVFRQYPSERATIDVDGATSSTSRGDAIVVTGDYTALWGFEVVDSSSVRDATRANMIVNDASHTKYINLVIHDGGIAFYNYSNRLDVEVAGCIIYNNGWPEPPYGNGHALYVKSDVGPLVLRDNVLFNQFGYGVHAYTNEGTGQLVNITVRGNASFDNGALSTLTSPNILVGGYAAARQITVDSNMTYFDPTLNAEWNIRLGWPGILSHDLTFKNNYVVGLTSASLLYHWEWETSTVRDNVFQASDVPGPNNLIYDLRDPMDPVRAYDWGGNIQYRDPAAPGWYHFGFKTWAQWLANTGLGSTDQVIAGTPSTTKVFVRKNTYEPGRANIIVYNWANLGSVNADLSGVLAPGDHYEIRSVQGLWGSPAASGTYGGGTVSLPMTPATSPPTPIGPVSRQPPTTGPAFDVFVVTKVS